ncbi:Isoleucine--tRNA ligase, partial [Mycoplasmopsis edwardii]
MTLANMYEIVEYLIIALAPILPTTSEEAYKFLNKANKQESVMLETLENISKANINYEVLEQYKEFFELRDKVNVLIENEVKNGSVKRANELELFLNVKDNEFLNSLDLKNLLSVGKITFSNDEFKVQKFESEKCLRCW